MYPRRPSNRPGGLPHRESASVSPRFPLYPTEAELDRIILGDEEPRLWSRLVGELTRDGLPPPRALFGNRRYLPAVLSYFDRREGLLGADSRGYADDGDERFD